MERLEIIDQGKRFIKSCIPFVLRHRLQIYISTHPESRITNCFRQDFIVKHHHAGFCHMMDFIEELDMSGRNACELGPGGSLSNAFYLYQLGGDSTCLIDVHNFVNTGYILSKKEYRDYVLPAEYEKKRSLPSFKDGASLEKYMKEINAVYYTDGLAGYKRVPNESVDFLYSCTVLQHIRRNIFVDSVNEMYRMMKLGAVGYHWVDLMDMMGGKKNHLRYSDEYWNDEVHRNMRCYTNRIQCREMCKIFQDAGFKIKRIEREYFDRLPIKKRLLNDGFKGLPKRELYTKTFSIIVEK